MSRSGVVPIVMGARPEDYVAYAPPHSFIHVDDFRSPAHLAEYLHWLDKNDTAYNEYFRWKDTWTAIRDWSIYIFVVFWLEFDQFFRLLCLM